MTRIGIPEAFEGLRSRYPMGIDSDDVDFDKGTYCSWQGAEKLYEVSQEPPFDREPSQPRPELTPQQRARLISWENMMAIQGGNVSPRTRRDWEERIRRLPQ